MFRSQTLVIVGAGASRELAMPDGSELTRIIGDRLKFSTNTPKITPGSGDGDILEALRLHGRQSGIKIERLVRAALSVSAAMPLERSIDDFVDTHPDDNNLAICAKLAIARSILEAERSSLLYREDKSTKVFQRLKSWHIPFFQLMKENVRRDSLHHLFNRLAFVIFNYDRSVEHFLYEAIGTAYFASPEERIAALHQLPIYHPYGVVGAPEWENEGTPYGGKGEHSAKSLLASASQVKTYSERSHEKSSLREMRELVASAETIIFLGFAFHPQNMELLRSSQQSNARNIFGTAYGVSEPNRVIMQSRIKQTLGRLPKNFFLEDLTCAELIKKYSGVMVS